MKRYIILRNIFIVISMLFVIGSLICVILTGYWDLSPNQKFELQILDIVLILSTMGTSYMSSLFNKKYTTMIYGT